MGGDAGCAHISGPARGDQDRETPGGRGGSFRGGDLLYREICAQCGARRVDIQIGLEPTPDAYVATLVEVFRAVWRVLRDDGTCWIVLGDSYAADRVGSAAGGPTSGLRRDGRPEEQRRAQAIACLERIQSHKPPRRFPPGLKPKDLVGIPWRVAFALQAPYYTGRIKSEGDRQWLAALTDGEGCLTILRTTSPHGSGDSLPPVYQIRMCDIEPLMRAQAITGYGQASPKQEPPSQNGNHGSYQWRLSGRKAADIAAEVYPYLLVKRKQAIILWNHQVIRDSYETKRGVTIPRAALEQQEFCRALVRQVIRREPVDLPSWMKEPTVPVEPGWYLRSDCIWAKPNPMPESVPDRPTKAHEYVFLLTKRARYFYDQEAVREKTDRPDLIGKPNGHWGNSGKDSRASAVGLVASGNEGTLSAQAGSAHRNLRTVWTLATEPYPASHFAVFPQALVVPCIKAGTSAYGCCAACGVPWARVVERVSRLTRPGFDTKGNEDRNDAGNPYRPETTTTTTGWRATCSCAADVVPATVLDIFAGSGTVLLVANALGRHAIGIEANPAYGALIRQRTAQRGLL